MNCCLQLGHVHHANRKRILSTSLHCKEQRVITWLSKALILESLWLGRHSQCRSHPRMHDVHIRAALQDTLILGQCYVVPNR